MLLTRHNPLGLNRLVIVLLLAGLMCQAAGASVDEELSPSVVLVLKLIAADRVQPVTGIVVSDSGLVLVPSEFVSTPAELIVLDGGTDITANGRPATIHTQAPETGFAILSVDGLDRPGIELSQPPDLYAEGSNFQAFPTARQIAAGAAAFKIPMEVGTTLPYVTGAILDSCGYLSGMTLAIGLQKPVPGQVPLIFDGEVLRDAFESLQLGLPASTCLPTPGETEDAVLEKVEESSPVEPGTSTVDTSQPDEDYTEPALPLESSTGRVELGPPPPITVDSRSPSNVVPWWLKLLGLLVLAVLAWRIIRARQQRVGPFTTGGGPVRSQYQPASDEPDTVRLSSGTEDPAPVPRSGSHSAGDLPVLDELPEGCNALVVLEGLAGAEPDLLQYCAVDVNDLDVVIGRGEADICIERTAVSRSHARLTGRGDVVMLEDLGSSNGTYLDTVPCLPGEVIYVQSGDQVCLGDVQMTIRLVTQGVDSA